MADIIKNGKYFTDFSTLESLNLSDILLLHDGSKVGSTNLESLKELILAGVDVDLAAIIPDGAGPHNSVYRGKDLGTGFTEEQHAAIKAGTFTDLFIGDYVTVNSVVYRIAAFDYYINCGDTATTDHHVVMVPDTILYNAAMNSSNTTSGGYVGSAMYTSNLGTAKTTITNAFGSDHILSHRVYLTNAVSSGNPSGGAWCDETVCNLMNEQMVYGGSIFMPTSYGGTIPANYRVEKSQLPLFRLRPDLIGIREHWWLRDVVSGAFFALVNSNGYADCYDASDSLGVRPAFCLKG